MNIVEIPARILFFLVALLLTIPAVMAVPLDRIQYRDLSGAARFKLTDKYLTAHWLNFYDPRQTTVAADLAMMREEATDNRTACLLRFFMFRNQAFEQTKHAETSATALAQMRDVLQFAQVNELIIEEGISWLLLSLITREHKSSMDERTRRIWAYEGAVKGLKLLERVPINELAAYHGGTYFLNHHLMYVGIYLFRIEEYELALRMFTLGQRAAHPSFDTQNPHFKRYAHFNWNFLNDVGECYRSMERYPEAIGAYRKAYLFGQKHRSVIQQAVSYGNIGTVLALQGKPTQALSYLSYAAQESARLGDCESEFNASSPLGSAYIACKQYEKAYPVLLRALVLHDSLQRAQYMPPTDSTRLVPIYVGLATVFQQQGKLNFAFTYSQLANHLHEQQTRLNNARQFRQWREKLENEEYLSKLERAETARQMAIWQRNIWLLILALVLLVCLGYFRLLANRRREAEAQLRMFANSAREKSELVDQLRADIQRQSPEVSTVLTDQSLLSMSILTPSDWDTFRHLFEQVYPQFLARLRQRYPDLTPAETRLICLSRLSLSTREMAATLGVSTDAVFKTRYRVRKKLNLPEATDLDTAFSTL